MATTLLQPERTQISGPTIDHSNNWRHSSFPAILNDFMHVSIPSIGTNPIRAGIRQSLFLQGTRDFILELNKFKSLCNLDSNYAFSELEDDFSLVISWLLNFEPDSLSFSLTNEGSVFFTLTKNGHEIHLNYFFEYDPEDFDDVKAVFTHYHNELQIESFGGSFFDIQSKLESTLNQEMIEAHFIRAY